MKNKVAIITGAGVGIGFEIAQQLIQQGAAVVLNDTNKKVLKKAVKQLTKIKEQVVGVVGDASDINIIEKLIATAINTFGRLDFAIANAGITTFGNFLDYPIDRFQQLVKVNLQGTFFLAQRAAKQMIRQGNGGRILLMSSVTGHTYHPELTAYGMSKAAIIFFAKTLGVELAEHQITVNAISPGATLTKRTMDLAVADEFQKMWERTTPNGKCATTQDIANTALFLLSDQAHHITSQTIIVDGGWTAMSPPPQ
ncbi:MAG: SDR family oxidoreductase [Bacteroidota bacterium]